MGKGTDRRVHSSIDKLPPQIESVLVSMIVDDVWSDEYQGKRVGKPRYRDMAEYLEGKGYSIHAASVGRFARRIRTHSKMKETGRMVREVMENLDGEKASQTQKATAEMLTAVIIERLVSGGEPTVDDIKHLAAAVKDCTWVAKQADEYIRQRIGERVERADRNIGAIAKRKHIDPDTLRAIREQVYGIVDERLGSDGKRGATHGRTPGCD